MRRAVLPLEIVAVRRTRLPGVYQPLAIFIMVASLLVAAWCFVAARRDRWID